MRPYSALESELVNIQNPVQYLGGEKGAVVKDNRRVSVHACLAFPDTYAIGMSHLGLQILYGIINSQERYHAERCFCPLPDMEALLRRTQTPLCSLETQTPLSKFDLIGISLQYELGATGVLQILDLGGVPLIRTDRSDTDPIVIAGGPLAFHPEPLADFIDAFVIGDSEDSILEIFETIERTKGVGRESRLQILASIPGVYVPHFYEPHYSEKGNYCGMRVSEGVKAPVTRRILPSLANAPFPKVPVVPTTGAVHDRIALEIMRGCVRGCRFCQAGYLYRPARERPAKELIELASHLLATSGQQEISLLSLSSADYCAIMPLLKSLREGINDPHVTISFPSTRVDAMSDEFVAAAVAEGRGSFTLAPEAGSQRLRNVINKNLTDEQILSACRYAFVHGARTIKLYMMIGLPSETDQDLLEMADLARRIRAQAPTLGVTLSLSPFVPKPFTPFQWAAQIEQTEVVRRQEIIRAALRKSGVTIRFHRGFSVELEGALCRGDRGLGRAILRAYQLGCRLDAWSESLEEQHWLQAFAETGFDLAATRLARHVSEPLPWDHIDCGIPKAFFEREWRKALEAAQTPDCLTDKCSGCGVCDFDTVRNVRFAAEPLEFGERNDFPGPAIARLRFTYQKQGPARFIAHLDLMHTFARACRRAQAPLAWSEAVRPLPMVNLGLPLQLGLESGCELVDLFLTQEQDPQLTAEMLQRELPDGIIIVRAENVPLRSPPINASVTSQTYTCSHTGVADLEGWRERKVNRRRKGSRYFFDLSSAVKTLERVSETELRFTLHYSPNTATLKPYEVVEALGLSAHEIRIRKVGVGLKESS